MFVRNSKIQKYYVILTSSIKRNYISNINNVILAQWKYNDEKIFIIFLRYTYVLQKT